jgi:peptide/nickel transport system ATP-binding protein
MYFELLQNQEAGREKAMDKLMEVNNLKTIFRLNGKVLTAIQDINFEIYPGEVLGVVGESGSGKSLTMKSIMGILPENAMIEKGKVLYKGVNILNLKEREKRKLRGKEISMIFQDPMTALNPLRTVEYHLKEVISRHQGGGKLYSREKAIEMLKKVGIRNAEERMKQYPHEFSGGMRQRVLIAMALSCEPSLLIADEPVTALDVTTQVQILNLLKKLQTEHQMATILITHDLGVTSDMCTRVIIMYGGHIMEEGTKNQIIFHPNHPYTRALLRSSMDREKGVAKRLYTIEGYPPSLYEHLQGCPFEKRCRFASEKCRNEVPEYQYYEDGHRTLCHFRGEKLDER